MVDVEMYVSSKGALRLFVKGEFILYPTLMDPKVDQHYEVEYQRGANPQLVKFGSVKSAGRTLARISYICIQNQIPFNFNSVTKKRFISEGVDSICMELPLSDETMEALLKVIQDELEELSKSAEQQKEQNGFV
ncbi:hypothetical protein [Psychromonas sp. MME2]|uniref:hypothetical protein n=1 Tax=unclassified Psychromonas TaxID=2614957 RepID=UPI00339BF0A1